MLDRRCRNMRDQYTRSDIVMRRGAIFRGYDADS